MAFNITRMTAYALISALEDDLRAILKNYIKDSSLINGELLDRAKSRIEKDIGILFGDLQTYEIVDYFDLGDTIHTLNSNKSSIPSHISKQIQDLTRRLEKIIPIRNRVMHIRPLNFDDLPFVSDFCREIIRENIIDWSETKKTIGKIEDDPGFVYSLKISDYGDDKSINHNLPIPDFDETGLIGRDKEIEQIKKLCLGGFPVISIVGEGGVGKSALALKVAYDLIESPSPFDAIVWVTSKTTQITISEIKEINGAIKSSLGVIQEIGSQVVGSGFDINNLDEVTDYLATFKIALFIDNLETILDDNIKQFVSALPQGSKIIITSRIGLGAYEYPVKLQGIAESYASQLLRNVAKLRGVESLATMPEGVLRAYVNRMHRNPSYIKWFVSCVQTGKTPEAVLQNSDIFLEFCMSNVYNYLSEDAKSLTLSMQCAPGKKDIPELAYLNNFDSLKVQRSIQELMATNMLSQSSITKGASIKAIFELSELARAYLGRYHKPSQSFQKSIRDQRNKLNSIFEQQLGARSGSKYSARNIKFRDKSDRVIVKRLHEAYTYIANAQHDRAYEILEEAHRLAPDFFEVARFMAYFHQKSGNLSGARESYELAIVLAPDTPQLHYWYGKFLLQSDDNVDDAVTHFEIARSLDESSIEVALVLARGYLFQYKYEATSKILHTLNNDIKSADDNLQKMYHDTEVQIHYRMADGYQRDSLFVDSLIEFERMKDKFDSLDDRFKDRHIRQKLKKCDYTLSKLASRIGNEYHARVSEIERWIRAESAL